MKAKLEDNERLRLIAENKEEEIFLRNIDAEGLRFFSSGRGHAIEGDDKVYEYLTGALPSLAQLKQILLTKEQVSILAYALGATYGMELTLGIAFLSKKSYLDDVLKLRDLFIEKIQEPAPLPPQPHSIAINTDKTKEE